MTSYLDEYQVRIRNRADSADLLVITSVAGGTNPYLKEPPKGDGGSFNPMTAEQMAGSYTVLVVDAITSGTDRVVTSKLEDVNALLQLGYLKTYIERRKDGGSWVSRSVGYLTLLRLVDAAVWELTVQDALRALDGVQLFNPTSTSTIADFLTAWPTRGCLFGGPLTAQFLNEPRTAGPGWLMRVRAGGGVVPSRTYWLDPMTIYGPSDDGSKNWLPRTQLGDINLARINEGLKTVVSTGMPDFNVVPFATVADTMAVRPWPGLITFIDRGAGAGFEAWRPLQPGYAGVIDDPAQSGEDIVIASKKQSGVFVLKDSQTALTVGSTVKVRCLSILPNEISPIYLDRHPIDLLSDLCTLAGIGFSDALGIKNLFGTGLRISLRITSAQSMGDLLRQAVFALGIGVRSDNSGNVVPFAMRKFANTPPTKTITDSLVVDGSVSLPFEQDVSQAGLQCVTFRHKSQIVLAGAPDSVGEQNQTFTELNGDANPLLSGTVEVSLAGMLRTDPLHREPVSQGWVAGFARELFDRFGRANQQGEFDLLRGDDTTDADTVLLGDEVLVAYSQLPNHNKRYGDDNTVTARAMQIIRLTEDVDRRPVRVSDSGPNAQPLATKPTHTIAASSDLPRTVAEATITNAATLNGLGYAVRIQTAIVAHGASAPATTDYGDVLLTTAAAIPTGAIRLPAVVAGSDVYVRARSELAGHRPSDWSAGVHVSLSLVDDPTSVAAAAVSGDGSYEDLSWVIGTNAAADVTDIWIRAAADAFSAAVRVATLLPGSTLYRLAGLTPATAYKASVQHRDPTTGDVSDPVDVAFTSDAGVATLSAPTNAIGFAETDAGGGTPIFTGLYGLAVTATEFPSSVEFQEAVETAAGSGAYGAYATVSTQPSISGDYTVFSRIAPNDGLHRRLKARHIRDGATASGFTTPIDVLPWTYAPLPAHGTTPLARITLAGDAPRTIMLTFDAVVDPAQLPITWQYRLVSDAGYAPGWTAGVGSLPRSIGFSKSALRQASVELMVTQLDGKSDTASYSVQGQITPMVTGAGNRITEDEARAGIGGVPVAKSRLDPNGVVSDDGVSYLIDTTTRRLTTDISGPTGVSSSTFEDGGNKAHTGFTSTTGDLVSTAKDNRGALLNNDFRLNTDSTDSVVDGTGSPISGGKRGQATIDSSNRVKRGNGFDDGNYGATATDTAGFDLHSSVVDSRASLLNTHFRLSTDSTDSVVDGTGSPISGGKRGQATIDSSNRVKRANGFDDGDYGARATNNTGLALHASVVDSRAALMNNTFRLNTDDTTSIVDGTGSPISGGKRGQIGLNSSNKLVTGVDAAATGSDGYANIESRRGAARQAGHAATGIVLEGRTRAGEGGVPVRDSQFSTVPVYDATGVQPMVDPNDIGALTSHRSLGTVKDRAKMHQSGPGAQTIASGGGATTLTWDTIDFDVGAGLASTGSGKMTIPADHLGLWLIHARIEWGANATSYRDLRIESSTAVIAESKIPPANGVSTAHDCWALVNDPAAGEWFVVSAAQATGVGLLLASPNTTFEIFRIW